jgi:hypothetical protein
MSENMCKDCKHGRESKYGVECRRRSPQCTPTWIDPEKGFVQLSAVWPNVLITQTACSEWERRD